MPTIGHRNRGDAVTPRGGFRFWAFVAARAPKRDAGV